MVDYGNIRGKRFFFNFCSNIEIWTIRGKKIMSYSNYIWFYDDEDWKDNNLSEIYAEVYAFIFDDGCGRRNR